MFFILFVVLAILSFLVAGAFFAIYRMFEGNNQKHIGKVSAAITETKHKKDVTIYGSDLGRRYFPIKLKHYSKSKYEYSVNGKSYKIKYWEASTAKQMPRSLLIVYLKRFPKIAYVKNDASTNNWDIYAIVATAASILCIMASVFIII